MSGLVGRKGLGPVGLVFLSLGAVTTLLPFYFMFVFSTHERSEIFSVPPPLWFGEYFLENVGILIQKIPFWINLGWSIYVGFAATALTLLFCSMAGFCLRGLQLPGQERVVCSRHGDHDYSSVSRNGSNLYFDGYPRLDRPTSGIVLTCSRPGPRNISDASIYPERDPK